jgi:hypothetical protein
MARRRGSSPLQHWELFPGLKAGASTVVLLAQDRFACSV